MRGARMSASRKYAAAGPEAEYEPGSRGRVLRNLLGITRVRDMNEAESQALELVQEAAIARSDLCLGRRISQRGHRQGGIPVRACAAHSGSYGGATARCAEAAHALSSRGRFGSGAGLGRGSFRTDPGTPISRRQRPLGEAGGAVDGVAGRVATAGFQPVFGSRPARLYRRHPGGIGGDYAPLAAIFGRVIERSRRRDASSRRRKP